MSTLSLKVKNFINQDIFFLIFISIIISILIILGNDYFPLVYAIGFLLAVAVVRLILKNPKFGLYLLIFNLPINLYIPFFNFGGDKFSISVNEVLLFLLLISLLLKKIYSGNLTFPNSRLNRPIFLLIGFNAISLLLAISDLTQIQYLRCWLYFFLWVEYFLVYFLILDLVHTDKEIKFIISLLLVSGAITVFSAIYQQIIGSELKSIGVVTETGKTYYRLATPFGFYSNHFGAYLLIILSILFHYYFSNKRKLIYFLLIIPTFYTLFYTFSRSSFLGLISLVIVLFITRREQRKKIVIISLTFLLVSLMIFTPVFLRWSKKAGVMKSGRLIVEHNIRERFSQWEASLSEFIKHPLIGKGFYTYRFRQINYSSHFGFVKYIDHPDNVIVKLLIESGIFGFITFIILIFKIYSSVHNFLRSKTSNDLRLISYIVLTSLTCFLITSMFETMFTAGRVTGPLFVLIGLVVVRARIESFKI